ncbi:MAG: DUF1302 family protein [Alphaproteobacteria bacterium]|nr:DUF1302 family protein [Alphaproteobacteria bacterium]
MFSTAYLRGVHCTVGKVPGKASQFLLATTALTGVLVAAPAGAVEYRLGEVSGAVDTIVSAGASMRTSGRDCENIGATAGGCQKLDGSGLQKAFAGTQTDDGNLNYDQWDVFSGAMKATSEIQASWRNFGAFVRGTAFVDPLVDNTDFRELESPQRSEVSQNAKLLDYFVSGSFDVGGQPLEVKLGNQVISWGESTFIQNGLSAINPIDVAAVRKPGSELKEFFTPILAARASLGLPNGFSVDGFYQFKSDNIVPDPSGTFFSSADFVGRGSQPLRGGVFDFGGDARFNPFLIANGLDIDTVWESNVAVNYPAVSIERANDKNADNGGEFGFALRYFASEFNQGTEFGLFFMNLHSRLPILELSTTNPAAARDTVTALALIPGGPGGFASSVGATPPGVPARNAYEVTQSICNILAANGGTFALAANGVGSASGTPFSFADLDGVPGFGAGDAPLNGTQDLLAGRVNLALPGGYTNCNNMSTLFNRNTVSIERTVAALLGNTQTYRLEYPEDIQVLGLSLSTTVGGVAVQAEATYRHDQPFNYAFAEMAALSNDLDGQTRLRTRAPQAGGLSPFGFPPGVPQVIAGAGAGPGGTNILDAAVTDFQPTFLIGLNQSAARSGEATFADLAAAQEAALGLAPGTINRGTPPIVPFGIPGGIPREVPSALADAAANGTLTAAAVLPLLSGFPDAAARAAQVAATSNAYGRVALDPLDTNLRTTTSAGTALPGGFTAPASAILRSSPTDVAFTQLAGNPVPSPQTKSSAIPLNAVSRDGFIKPAYEDVFTAQTTLTSLLFASNPFVEFAGANGGVLVTEVGMVMVPGISSSDGLQGGNTKGLVNSLAAQTSILNPDLELASGYATKFSWGAQGLMSLTYNRAFGSPINLVPSVAWKWDFGGNTPAPFGNYQAERKAITLGVSGTYLANWAGSVSWTSNFGPDAPLNDRDFASVTVSYAF